MFRNPTLLQHYCSHAVCLQRCKLRANFRGLKIVSSSGSPRFPDQIWHIYARRSICCGRSSCLVSGREVPSWANEGLVMIRNYRVESVARKIPSRKEIFTRRGERASGQSVCGGAHEHHRLRKYNALYILRWRNLWKIRSVDDSTRENARGRRGETRAAAQQKRARFHATFYP